MPLHVLLLTGSIAAGAPRSKVTEVMVPSGERWSLQEVRFLTSNDDVSVYLNITVGARSETLINTTGKIANVLKLPYPMNIALEAGAIITIEAANPTASAQTIWLELVYDTG